MPERLPFSILTYDTFVDEYVDEDTTSTYQTEAETKFEADHLATELQSEAMSSPDDDPAYKLHAVGPDGDRIFYTRS